jgi:allantoinase
MLSLRSTRVVFEDETRPATLRIDGGVVTAIDDGPADHDLGDLVVLPGLVDSHVHVNEPGRTEWEGYVTATRAAAAGGSTTIVDMPLNSIPPTTSVAALDEKRAAALGRLSVDVGFWGGVVPGSEPEVEALTSAGVSGFKAFLTDSGVPEFGKMTVSELSTLELAVPLLVHAESDSGLRPLSPGAGYGEYLASRPPEAEAMAIREISGFQGEVHILHVSSADGVEAIASGPVSGETCPHYLTFSADDVAEGRTEFKCAPPIRDAAHREALWEGLVSGALSMVVSDHSPSPPEMKRGDFARAWGGISSLQLRLQVVWTGAAQRRIGFEVLADWLALAPARLAGLHDRKGSIAVGKHADLVVFDPEGETLVHGETLHHRHGLTPYEGMRLRGAVRQTFLRGRLVSDGVTVDGPHGRMLTRK